MALLIFALLAFVLSALSEDFFAGLLSLLLAPLIGVTWLLLIRMSFEALVAGIKTAENTAEILEILKKTKELK